MNGFEPSYWQLLLHGGGPVGMDADGSAICGCLLLLSSSAKLTFMLGVATCGTSWFAANRDEMTVTSLGAMWLP